MFKTVITDSVYQNIISEEEKKKPSSRSYLYRLLANCKALDRLVLLTAEETATLAEHPEMVMENPSSFYVLDIAPEKAKAIQESYGVICTSGANPDMFLLIDVNDIHNPNQGEKLGRGWDSLLDSVEDLPSNALVVTDRYLFTSRNKNIGDGLDNMRCILHELLPERLDGEFQLTVVFCKDKMDESYTFSQVAQKLHNIVKQQVNGRYPFMTELFGIPEGTSFYDRLHSRRIVSNYYLVEATHKLAAFNQRVGTAQQTLIPMGLFTKSSLRGESTPPLNSIDQTVKNFSLFYRQILSPKYTKVKYLYALNGEVKPKCTSIRNRLLK